MQDASLQFLVFREGRTGLINQTYNRQARRLSYGIGKSVEKKRWE